MSLRSLRVRAVVAAAAAILLALVVLGAAVSLLVSRHLHRTLDQTLRSRAVDVAQLSASAPALLTSPGALDSPLNGAQVLVEVLDRSGRIVARSLALRGRVIPTRLALAALARGRPQYAGVRLGDERDRVYAAPLADLGGPASGGAVLVAASTNDLRETLASLRLFVLLSALGAATVGGVGVAVLLTRALRPLSRLAVAAADIERTGDARRRLPELNTGDELQRLATTLNAMLTSLEHSRDAERRFLADASHELRTPLTALRGNVSFLRRHGATPEVVDELERDSQRLARLANDLLALSREEASSAPAERVELSELARRAMAPDVDVAALEPVSVRGDTAALERALANLVENARVHGPAGGRITVSTTTVAGRALLRVGDEGSGLTPEAAEHAFERFWRGDGGRGGSGLGLAIVRATAERHGGRAYVDGAVFTIDLPALRDVSDLPGTPPDENS